MHKKKWDYNPLKSLYQKQNTNQTLKQTKQNKEKPKTHKRNSLFKKSLHYPTRWAKSQDLQNPKPKKYYKQTKPRERQINLPKKTYNFCVYIWKHYIYNNILQKDPPHK